MTVDVFSREQQLQLHRIKRVLLIEDNDVNRMLLSDYLSYYGYNVQSLSKGSELFSAIEEFQPDLMLLDLKLPDIDGYLLLEQIQKQPHFAKIPIIVVSAFAFKADQERALSLGACHYFVKPVNLKDLILTIEEELTCRYL